VGKREEARHWVVGHIMDYGAGLGFQRLRVCVLLVDAGGTADLGARGVYISLSEFFYAVLV
jgi:hypothetical protein